MAENQIEKLMRILGISEDEAKKLVEDDKKIDKGEKLFELSKEQEKASKKARQADRKPTVYKFDNSKREKKKDAEKSEIISALVSSVENLGGSSIEITNAEREFIFHLNNIKYKIVLSKPRSWGLAQKPGRFERPLKIEKN